MYCSDLQKTFQCILVTDISDHLPIVFIDQNNVTDSSECYIWRRNMSQRNRQAFAESGNCMQQAYSLFHSKLYNTHFPKQKLKLKYNTRKLWLTPGLKDAIKRKTRGLSAYTARSSFKLFSIATNACTWMLAKQGERQIKKVIKGIHSLQFAQHIHLLF